MEAIITTIDEEYVEKCMDAGMAVGSNLPAGSAHGNAGAALPAYGEGGQKKKKGKAGGKRNEGLPPSANKPAGSAYKSLSEWRMRKGSIAPSEALGSKSSRTVQSQTGGSDSPFGYQPRDGSLGKKKKNKADRARVLSSGKKIGDNTPAGSAY